MREIKMVLGRGTFISKCKSTSSKRGNCRYRYTFMCSKRVEQSYKTSYIKSVVECRLY